MKQSEQALLTEKASQGPSLKLNQELKAKLALSTSEYDQNRSQTANITKRQMLQKYSKELDKSLID